MAQRKFLMGVCLLFHQVDSVVKCKVRVLCIVTFVHTHMCGLIWYGGGEGLLLGLYQVVKCYYYYCCNKSIIAIVIAITTKPPHNITTNAQDAPPKIGLIHTCPVYGMYWTRKSKWCVWQVYVCVGWCVFSRDCSKCLNWTKMNVSVCGQSYQHWWHKWQSNNVLVVKG